MAGSGIQNTNGISAMLPFLQGNRNNAATDGKTEDFAAIFQTMSASAREDLYQYVGDVSGKEQKTDVFQVAPANGAQGNIKSADSGSGKAQRNLNRTGASGREEIRTEEKQPSVRQETDPTEDVTEKFVEEAKKILMEAFGVTEEELMSTMSMLGLTFTDLMDTQNFVQLSMELTHSGFAAILLVSEQYQTALEQFTMLVNDLSAVLGVTPEELQNALAQMIAEQGSPEFETVLQEQIQASPDTVPEESVPDVGRQPLTAEQQIQTSEENPDGISQEKPVVQQPETGEHLSGNSEDGSGKDANSGLNQAVAGTEKQGETQAQHMSVTTNFETVYDAASRQTVTTVTQTTMDMQSIMEQFTQTVRVFTGTDQSSIQMQLTPEHLGKIFLHVSEIEGQIRAQIAVQNEAVREAMASQVAALKETLNQQGVRVEAVEVTIASHEFERNLEEQNQGAAKEQEQENRHGSGGRRNINLQEEEPIQGLMSEEETLVMQMMQDHGNTVDFTA